MFFKLKYITLNVINVTIIIIILAATKYVDGAGTNEGETPSRAVNKQFIIFVAVVVNHMT